MADAIYTDQAGLNQPSPQAILQYFCQRLRENGGNVEAFLASLPSSRRANQPFNVFFFRALKLGNSLTVNFITSGGVNGNLTFMNGRCFGNYDVIAGFPLGAPMTQMELVELSGHPAGNWVYTVSSGRRRFIRVPSPRPSTKTYVPTTNVVTPQYGEDIILDANGKVILTAPPIVIGTNQVVTGGPATYDDFDTNAFYAVPEKSPIHSAKRCHKCGF